VSNSAGIDLRQFYQVFFEEAGENIAQMEQMLLALDVDDAQDEDLNAIFRAAHSIKGGAATFGFSDLADVTHEMETLLDQLRRRERAPTAEMIDALLESGDVLKELLAGHEQGRGQSTDVAGLVAKLRRLSSSAPVAPSAAPSKPSAAIERAVSGSGGAHARSQQVAQQAAQGSCSYLLTFAEGVPDSDVANAVALFGEIGGMGSIEPVQDAQVRRAYRVTTTSTPEDLLDLLSFHVDKARLGIRPAEHVRAEVPSPAAGGGQKDADKGPDADEGFGFFEGAPGTPQAAAQEHASDPAPAEAGGPGSSARAAQPSRAASREKPNSDAGTLRVSVEKVDQLINLVGELVITHSALLQAGGASGAGGGVAAGSQRMLSALADLTRNTRDLQEAVMSIRMIPMSAVFNRFPRMLRDLAAKLGKKVDLVFQGEATELDKGLVEKITDPLTHLVRNSCDHGIEAPEDRLAKGKSENGTITLVASHQGGSIVIEVRDDGRGLNRDKLIRKARERGIDAPDTLTDSQVWDLIFAPGFSTAEQVTEVSGRGVGMDVVKKNITALGGTVEIDSAEGYDMTVRVRLPLTLAIMDGMAIALGGEVYILPLSNVVEALHVQDGVLRPVAGSGRVVEVHGQYLPVRDLGAMFSVSRDEAEQERANSIIVIVESEQGRMALMVDALLGQQQIVVKNLETNYRRVEHVSGATILGDGRVALILDVPSMFAAWV
jgi:two-component system chemotaxis sensor kinase CheA